VPARENGVECLAQHLFHRPFAGLPRPSPEPGAVVLERQPEQRHETGSTSRTRPSTAITTTSSPGATPAGPRASQTSPSSFTWPLGVSARTTTAVRPTSVSTPTVARRRFDQRTKNVVSAASIAKPTTTATIPHGDGSTVRASTIATIVSTRRAYGVRLRVGHPVFPRYVVGS